LFLFDYNKKGLAAPAPLFLVFIFSAKNLSFDFFIKVF